MLDKQLEIWATERPEGIALRSVARDWSWREYADDVAHFAAYLKSADIRRLALALDNGPEWAIADLACLKNGTVCIPVPPFFSVQQQQWLLDTSGADAILGGTPRRGWQQDESMLGMLQRRHLSHPPELPAGTAKITYTSGTTNHPKGVCLSVAGMSWNAETLSGLMQSLDLQRHMVTLPLSTLLENICGIYVPLILGVESVILPSSDIGFGASGQFNPDALGKALTTWQPHSVVLVPELLRVLFMFHQTHPASTTSLHFVAVGGGKVSPSLLSTAHARGLPVYEGYGLSECGSVVSLNLPGANHIGSAGKPLPGIHVHIDSQGELQVVSPGNAIGYLGERPFPTPYATGDLGQIDDEGYIQITGRRRNVQITAFGRNFSPEWVEAEAMACPAVRRLVIFGEGLAKNVALVDAFPGMEQAAREQLKALSDRLPDYAKPHHLLFTSMISGPKALTANGRIRRDDIWHMMQQYIICLNQEA